MKNITGCGRTYGKIEDIDQYIGNVYKLHKNPYKRYFVESVAGLRSYFENLASARVAVVRKPQSYVRISQSHIDDELSRRTVRSPQNKSITKKTTVTFYEGTDIVEINGKSYGPLQ